MRRAERRALLLLAIVLGAAAGVALAGGLSGSSSTPIEVKGGAALPLAVTRVPMFVEHQAVTAVAMSANGALVLAGERGLFSYYSPADTRLQGGQEFGWRIPQRVEGLAVSGDGSTVVAGSNNGGASVWHVENGQLSEGGAVPYEAQASLALDYDGDLLAKMEQQSIFVYDLSDDREVARLHVALPLPLSGTPTHGEVQQAYALGFNATSTELVLVGLQGAEAWSIASQRRSWSFRCRCGATDAALSDNARYAVFGTTGGQAIVLDLRDRRVISEVTATVAHGAETTAVQTDDYAHTLVAASGSTLSIWRSSHQLAPPSNTHLSSERATSIAITSSGDRLLVGTEPRPTRYYTSTAGPAWLVRIASSGLSPR